MTKCSCGEKVPATGTVPGCPIGGVRRAGEGTRALPSTFGSPRTSTATLRVLQGREGSKHSENQQVLLTLERASREQAVAGWQLQWALVFLPQGSPSARASAWPGTSALEECFGKPTAMEIALCAEGRACDSGTATPARALLAGGRHSTKAPGAGRGTRPAGPAAGQHTAAAPRAEAAPLRLPQVGITDPQESCGNAWKHGGRGVTLLAAENRDPRGLRPRAGRRSLDTVPGAHLPWNLCLPGQPPPAGDTRSVSRQRHCSLSVTRPGA